MTGRMRLSAVLGRLVRHIVEGKCGRRRNLFMWNRNREVRPTCFNLHEIGWCVTVDLLLRGRNVMGYTLSTAGGETVGAARVAILMLLWWKAGAWSEKLWLERRG